MVDHGRIRIDIEEKDHVITIEIWKMKERSEDGSTWEQVVKESIPPPEEK